MMAIINDDGLEPMAGITSHPEGADLLPANSSLAGVELVLVQTMGRETVLRQYIEKLEPSYDYIIIDCAPTAGLLTVNALAAADSIIIPICPKYLDAKGLELLLQSVAKLRHKINPTLTVEVILLTMVDRRAKLTRQ
jgi:chromosome partitioning protein